MVYSAAKEATGRHMAKMVGAIILRINSFINFPPNFLLQSRMMASGLFFVNALFETLLALRCSSHIRAVLEQSLRRLECKSPER